MGTYNPIQPVTTPTLMDSFLGAQSNSGGPVPQLSFLNDEQVITARNITAPDSTTVAYTKSEVFYRLNANPIKLRHNGTTVDEELYADSYSFSQDSPALAAPQVLYPPADPYNYDWGSGSYYTRSTSLYVFPGIVVPARSTQIWDARYPICVDSTGATIPSTDSIPVVQGLARAAIESSSLVPTYVVGLGNLGQTQEPQNYQSTSLNLNTYNVAVQAFLDANYNTSGISAVPSDFTSLPILTDAGEMLPAAPESYLVANSNIGSSSGSGSSSDTVTDTSTQLAALINGYYFIEWVAYQVTTTTTSGGGD